MLHSNIQKNKGFTLVELLVSIAIFSIVLIVVMGSIITIIDTNRKARSLTIVMNDLNFVLESVTRTIKTGEITYPNSDGADTRITVVNQDEEEITYEFDAENGVINKTVGSGGTPIAVTSNDININNVRFDVFGIENNDDVQPRVLILVEGTAAVSPKISSSFKIQTTVSQRNLDI